MKLIEATIHEIIAELYDRGYMATLQHRGCMPKIKKIAFVKEDLWDKMEEVNRKTVTKQ